MPRTTKTSHTTQTTTLIVTLPADFSQLEASFRLIRYELPAAVLRRRNNKNDYGRMHNCLRDQLNYPYRVFTHDKLDGKDTNKWVAYVLYPLGTDPQRITIPFLTDTPLPWRDITFAQLDLHLLLKLLHIAYFLGEKTGRFVGEDSCYVLAKVIKEDRYDICLQIELQGDTRNQENTPQQEFKVVGSACPFRRVDMPLQEWPHAYFGRRITGKKPYFVHLKKTEVAMAIQEKKPIYEIRRYEGRRTTLTYHDLQGIEQSVGKLLFDFIRDFTAYLIGYGITAHSKERTFTEFVPPKGQTQLPLALLNPIYIYDNRLQRSWPLQRYLDLLAQQWPDIQFAPVIDLAQARTDSILVLQDYAKEDFEAEGILHGKIDPYAELYTHYPQLSKQSLNVNLLEEGGYTTVEEYLGYALPQASDTLFQQKLEMALSQLYLKDAIINERSVRERLPLLPVGYVFIRKARYSGNAYETLLSIDGDTLHFVDLRDPNGRDRRDEILHALRVPWETMYERMRSKYHKTESGEEVKDYDVIVGPGLFIELEDIKERVLYNYDEIVRRQAALDEPLQVDDLKLVPHYDRIRLHDYLSSSELLSRGLLESNAHPRETKEEQSLKLYQRFEQYDSFLEEIGRTHVAISFRDLTQGERMERIGHIFDIHPDQHGHYNRRDFKKWYQRLGWFPSDKASDVHMYEGIWYDEDNCYMVGSPMSLKQKQPRAHLIRRFDVYMRQGQFDIQPLLRATSVQFVRLKQYTVYPYAFHLIDLYVENVLRFQ